MSENNKIKEKIYLRIKQLEIAMEPYEQQYDALNATQDWLTFEYTQRLDELEWIIATYKSGIDELNTVLSWCH